VRRITAIPLLAAAVMCAAEGDYAPIKRKLDSIESDRLPPGARVEFSPAELSAYGEKEAPAGVRNPRIHLGTPEVVTGTALIDFEKVEQTLGQHPGWLMSKLLGGERPVSVTARIRSSDGRATVEVQRVEISGVVIDGRTLDFLIQNLLLPMYPTAVVGRPFELGHRIQKVDVRTAGVVVVIGR